MGRPLSSGPGVAGATQLLLVKGQVGKRTCVTSTLVSFSAAPTAGRLQIVGQQSEYEWDVDIIAGGTTDVPFPESGLEFEYGEDVLFTLSNTAAAVVGKINATVAWRTPDQATY